MVDLSDAKVYISIGPQVSLCEQIALSEILNALLKNSMLSLFYFAFLSFYIGNIVCDILCLWLKAFNHIALPRKPLD